MDSCSDRVQPLAIRFHIGDTRGNRFGRAGEDIFRGEDLAAGVGRQGQHVTGPDIDLPGLFSAPDLDHREVCVVDRVGLFQRGRWARVVVEY